MINHPFQYRKDGLKVTFNWNEEVSPCKQIKVSLGDKKVILTREEFSTLMAVFADDDQMENIIQTEKVNFVSIERMLRVKTLKDLKAEESLVFPYVYWIPETEYNKLKEDGEMVKLVESSKKQLKEIISDNEAAKDMKKMWQDGKLN